MFGWCTSRWLPVSVGVAGLGKMGVDLAERSVENMSLREMLRDAERLCRDLADHLDRGFAHKAQALGRLLRSDASGDWNEGVTDRSVYDSADLVLSSHAFTERILRRIRELLRGIDSSVTGITSGLSR